MSLRRLTTFQIEKGKGAEFVSAFAPIAERVRHEPGNEQYELFVAHEDADKVLVVEQWLDQASTDAALARHYRGPNDPALAFLQLIAEAPRMESYPYEAQQRRPL